MSNSKPTIFVFKPHSNQASNQICIKKTLTLFEDLGILQICFGLKRKIDLVATQQQIATQNCTESKIKN